MGGNIERDKVSHPQTGNGFIKTEEPNQPVIPEWNIEEGKAIAVQKGTTIWQVVDGKQRKYAEYDEDGKFKLIHD